MSLTLVLLKQITEIKLFIGNVECLLNDGLIDALEDRVNSIDEISGVISLVENMGLSIGDIVWVYYRVESILALRAVIALVVHLLSARFEIQ